MNTDPINDLPLSIGLSLMTGLTAGVGANYYLNHGSAYLIGFIIAIYPLILGMVIAARRIIRWFDERFEDEKEEPPHPQYAS